MRCQVEYRNSYGPNQCIKCGSWRGDPCAIDTAWRFPCGHFRLKGETTCWFHCEEWFNTFARELRDTHKFSEVAVNEIVNVEKDSGRWRRRFPDNAVKAAEYEATTE